MANIDNLDLFKLLKDLEDIFDPVEEVVVKVIENEKQLAGYQRREEQNPQAAVAEWAYNVFAISRGKILAGPWSRDEASHGVQEAARIYNEFKDNVRSIIPRTGRYPEPWRLARLRRKPGETIGHPDGPHYY